MNYTKFSDDILRKKINSSIKDIREMKGFLNLELDSSEELCTETDRVKLEELCTNLAAEAKNLKGLVKKAEEQAAEERRKEEELERELQRQEKERKQEEIKNRSIIDKELLVRLKFRFFNLAVPDSEDPEGLNPLSSGPFFEDKISQFRHELVEKPFRLFSATYVGDDMSGKEEYMQKNLNKTFVSIIEEDFKDYLFVCFRVILTEGRCIYRSYWVSNLKEDLTDLFPTFEFTELDRNTQIDDFVNNFDRTQQDQNNTSHEMVIDEIYAR